MLLYDRKKVGAHLKAAREKADLTQYEVSSQLGHSSPQYLSNVERGVCVVSLPILAKIVRMYKADPKPLEKIILQSQERLLIEKLRKEGSLR